MSAVAAALTIVLIVKIILLKNKPDSADIGVMGTPGEVEDKRDAVSMKGDKHGDNPASGAGETVPVTENKPEGEDDGEYDPRKPYYDKEKPEDTRF